MTNTTSAREKRLDGCRDYLLLLARIQINPRLQAKVDASDVVQQALLEANKCQSQFRGKSDTEFLAWLRTILANVLAASARRFGTEARDLNREQSLQAALEHSSSRLEHLLAADQTSPSERAVRNEDLVRLAHAMTGLPNDQRQVVEMHHLRGLPLDAVARQISRSRPAVAGLLFRGLKRLRELLSDGTGALHESQHG